MKRIELLELVKDMKDEVDDEELMYRLYVRNKLIRAREDVATGRVIPHEQVAREIEQWLK